MQSWVNFLIVMVLLLDLMMLSSSRIRTCIKIAAAQGVLVVTAFFIHDWPSLTMEMTAIFLISVILKGIIFPWLLFRAVEEANIRREVEPLGGYPLSLLMGVGLFALSFWLSARLHYTKPLVSTLAAPVAFTTFFIGALIIVSRVKAITQVIGYLIMENGIYLFGAAFLGAQSLLVESGILLDIFVTVFIMGITIFHINREFDHIDTDQLSVLKDFRTSREG